MTGPLIGRVLPPGIEAVERSGDLDQPLFPAEAAAIAAAVDERRREFTTGRALARAALGRLGSPRVEIGIGPGGAPIWPPGVVGSITHCAGYRAAAVAPTSGFAAIGIDAEPNQALPDGVLAVAASDAEQAALAELRVQRPAVAWDRLLFSAKESAYKAWFPLTGAWLDYEQVEIDFRFERHAFTARPAAAEPWLRRLPGRWAWGDGLLVTAVVLPAPRR